MINALQFTDTLDKNKIESLAKNLINIYTRTTNVKLLDNIKYIACRFVTKGGFSLSLQNLRTINKGKNKAVYIANKQLEKIKNISLEQFYLSKNNKELNIWSNINSLLKDYLMSFFKQKEPLNHIFVLSNSGARGNADQIYQITGMRGLLSNQTGDILDYPINHSLKEGLSFIEFFFASFGARKGILDTSLKTSDSGYLTRRLVEGAYNLTIRELNCRNKRSIFLDINENNFHLNLLERILLNTIKIKKTIVKKEHAFYSEDILIGEKNNLRITVKSPFACKMAFSLCQNCVTLKKTNQKINLGYNIGINSAHNIGETGTQMTMRTFHTGGSIGGTEVRSLIAEKSGFLQYVGDNTFTVSNWQNKYQEIKITQKEKIKKNKSFIINASTIFIHSNKKKQEQQKKTAIVSVFSPIIGEKINLQTNYKVLEYINSIRIKIFNKKTTNNIYKNTNKNFIENLHHLFLTIQHINIIKKKEKKFLDKFIIEFFQINLLKTNNLSYNKKNITLYLSKNKTETKHNIKIPNIIKIYY